MWQRTTRGRGLVLGALGWVLAGCASASDLTCASDQECLESEVCHPELLQCTSVCTTIADCPKKAKRCEAISDTNFTRVCKCTADCEEQAPTP